MLCKLIMANVKINTPNVCEYAAYVIKDVKDLANIPQSSYGGYECTFGPEWAAGLREVCRGVRAHAKGRRSARDVFDYSHAGVAQH